MHKLYSSFECRVVLRLKPDFSQQESGQYRHGQVLSTEACNPKSCHFACGQSTTEAARSDEKSLPPGRGAVSKPHIHQTKHGGHAVAMQ